MDALDAILSELDDIVKDLDAISLSPTSEDQLYHEDDVQSNTQTLEDGDDDNDSISVSLNFSAEIQSDEEFSEAESFGAPNEDIPTAQPFDIDSISFIDESDENDEQGCDSEVVDRALECIDNSEAVETTVECIDRTDLDKAGPTAVIQCQDINIDLSSAHVEPQLLLPEALPGVTRILLETRLILRQASAKLHLAIKIILVQAARQLRISYRRIVLEQQSLVGEEGWTEELAERAGVRLMDVTDRTVRMAVEFIKNASRDVVEVAVETIKESVASVGEEAGGEMPEIEYKTKL